jgi:hypothetical protein
MQKKGMNEIIYLEIEKSRINREKSRIVLNKSLSLYVLFMLVGIIGFVFDYIDSKMLNALIITGIIVLVIGTIPYLLITHKEENKIKDFLRKLRK